ncbi:arsenate reductase ArsC [Estrella lausannensis]|uniref:Protein tyrosine phosphatase n=1 Tax=Estrella lausannensis TaxID=483423 RepID=A0A0H5DQ89_9BACT|nr:arsenate reductase ArsC [Estrella lausannensis]CRX37704.1 protein tyrosine phosphatase [Estrella lausannensis]
MNRDVGKLSHPLIKKILFVCTGNSCRSQMAEGWVRKLKCDILESFSAGIEKHGIDPVAVRVMSEAGVDISTQRSKLINELGEKNFDYVVTICNDANEKCPVFPGEFKRLHHSFDNPPVLSRNTKSEEESLAIYRRVRDEIRSFVENMPNNL